MSTRPAPAYLVIEEPFVLADPKSFLGRLVVDMHDPRRQYAPMGSVSLGLDDLIPAAASRTTVGLAINGQASDRVKGRLRRLLALGAAHEDKLQMDLDSALVRTYELEQHATAFLRIAGGSDDGGGGAVASASASAVSQQQVRSLLSGAHDRVYMVVGVKTAVDAGMTVSTEQSRTVAGGGGGFFPSGFVALPAPSPQVEVASEHRAAVVASGLAAGEQIFALKYSLVKLERRLEITKKPDAMRLSARLKTSAVLKGPQRHGKPSGQVLAFGLPSSSSSSSSSPPADPTSIMQVEYKLEEVPVPAEDEDLFFTEP